MTVADTGFLAPVWIAAFDTEEKLQRLAGYHRYSQNTDSGVQEFDAWNLCCDCTFPDIFLAN